MALRADIPPAILFDPVDVHPVTASSCAELAERDWTDCFAARANDLNNATAAGRPSE